jgi:hypothetical protein
MILVICNGKQKPMQRQRINGNKAWLFTMEEFSVLAQQTSGKGMHNLFMYVEAPKRIKHNVSAF